MSQTTGIVFPLILTNGKHTLVSGVDLIQASLKTIISWELRTRFFNSDFGSRANEVLEEQNYGVLYTLIKKFVIDAISKWEQRIELKSISISRPTSYSLVVSLNYIVLQTNISEDFSYTFYTN